MKSFLKVFLIIYLPVLTVLLISSFVFKNAAVNNAKNELIHEMKNKWYIFASLEEDFTNSQKFHKKIINISKETALRVTVVNELGIVIDDSYLSIEEIKNMENHINRPEIKNAVSRGEGYSERYSNTIKKEMMYYAKVLKSGKIVRLAYTMEYVNSVGIGFTKMFHLFNLFFLVVIGGITLFLARKITFPVKQLDSLAEKVESGEKNIVFPEFQDETMTHISSVIYRIYKSLNEEQLKFSEEKERLGKIFSTLEEGILLLNSENKIERCNGKLSEMLGTKFEKGMIIPFQLVEFKTISFFKNILDKNDTYFSSLEFDDSYFEVYTRLVGNSKLIVLHDITEKEKYINYKTDLIGNISHELKTPVATVMGYSETLLSHDDIDRETENRFLKTIFQSSKRLNDLINDILELHKLEIENVINTIENVDISEIIEELTQMYGSKKDKKLSINSNVSEMKIGYEHLISLMTNLIGNAFKYSDGNEVFVNFQKENKEIVITVDDKGPIILEEERGRIFERFYTVSKSRNKDRAGTGLGLAIVKHIVEKYEGKIKLKTNSYNGNSFVIKFQI